jgi:integrase
MIGDIEIRKLIAHDVRGVLTRLANERSSRAVVIAHSALTRALRHAEANRHVLHNAAALVDTPMGQQGRNSKALTAEQAAAVLKAAGCARLGAYIVLCLLTGIRTEEARAIRWDHVDRLDRGGPRGSQGGVQARSGRGVPERDRMTVGHVQCSQKVWGRR